MAITAGTGPARADGLELIGEMRDSGYRVPPALVRRRDGQTVQLTPLLYAVLEEIRDGRPLEEVAARVSERTGRSVTTANVRALVDGQLRPLGLVTTADGRQPALRRSDPLLGLRWKVAVTDPERTRRMTRPFAALFHPVLTVLIVSGFGLVAWWVLLDKGLGSAAYEAFSRPGLLLVVLAVMLLSAGFHEFGHAAAATRGGATPGVMGAGIYLVWPAFYTDVTDSYRLGRAGRLRTDLGGLYFDALVALGVFATWWLTGWDGWLLVVATQLLGMVRQLAPLVRFDGYHILCDLTGVPDLFTRIGPVLLSFLPRHWRSPAVTALKPWVRVVVRIWVLAVVPVLGLALVAVLFALPRIAGTSWFRVQQHAGSLADLAAAGDWWDAAGRAVAVVATGLPVLAAALMLGRLGLGAAQRAWRATEAQPVRRAVAGAVGVAVLATVAVAWWPQPGRYDPVQPWERGTLLDAAPVAAARVALGTGYQGGAYLSFPADATLPTRQDPLLAMVLIPQDTGDATPDLAAPADGATGASAPEAPPATGEETWVFPFDRPLEPGPGDNQALAVNTTDGSTSYDVAFALVWADGADQVDHRNEAFALASCSDCTTVAVAFQVLLVVGQADVVIPENVAAAVNYNCVACVTVALAQQLVVTLDRLPGAEAVERIRRLWAELMEFSETIEGRSFAEIEQTLDEFEVAVLEVLGQDGALQMPATVPPNPSGSAATPGPTGSPLGTDGPTVGTGTAPDDTLGPADDGSAGATGEPTAEGATQEPTPAPTPSGPASSPVAGSDSGTASDSAPVPSGTASP